MVEIKEIPTSNDQSSTTCPNSQNPTPQNTASSYNGYASAQNLNSTTHFSTNPIHRHESYLCPRHKNRSNTTGSSRHSYNGFSHIPPTITSFPTPLMQNDPWFHTRGISGSNNAHFARSSGITGSVTTISAKDFPSSSPNNNSTPLSSNPRQHEDKKLLLKYGITIFESDLATLTDWLSDSIVNFAAMHLFDRLPENVKQRVNIIQSTSCDMIKFDLTTDLSTILKDLNITPNKWQFFMFNNNSQFGYDRGSHWNLLLFNPERKGFRLVDSMSAGVSHQIQQFASKIMTGMGMPPQEVKNVASPKMDNGGDCGIYLIEYLKCILTNLANNQPWHNFGKMNDKIYMKSRRQYWYNLIMDLSNTEPIPVDHPNNLSSTESVPQSTNPPTFFDPIPPEPIIEIPVSNMQIYSSPTYVSQIPRHSTSHSRTKHSPSRSQSVQVCHRCQQEMNELQQNEINPPRKGTSSVKEFLHKAIDKFL